MSIRHVYDTAANLTSADLTLGAGEFGIESDTGLVKIGDGSTAWTSLEYAVDSRRFIPITDLPVTFSGTPAAAALSSSVVHRAFDASTFEALIGHCEIPNHWQTFDTFLWTVNHAGGGAGNIVAQVYYRFFADSDDDGTATTAVDTGAVTVAIAGTSGIVERSQLGSALTPVISSRAPTMIVYRLGSDGSDTFASDIGIIGVELVRAS